MLMDGKVPDNADFPLTSQIHRQDDCLLETSLFRENECKLSKKGLKRFSFNEIGQSNVKSHELLMIVLQATLYSSVIYGKRLDLAFDFLGLQNTLKFMKLVSTIRIIQQVLIKLRL